MLQRPHGIPAEPAPAPPPAAPTYATPALSRPLSAGAAPILPPVRQYLDALVESTDQQRTVTQTSATGEVTVTSRAEAGAAVLGRGTGAQLPAGRVLTGVLTPPSAPPRTPGTVYYRGGRRAGERGRRLARLRVDAHAATPAALDQLAPPAPAGGLLVGVDRDGRPVLVRMFRPEPTSIVLIGGVWAAQLLAFRALALGARVFADTVQPIAWSRLGPHGVHLSAAEPPPATAEHPILVVGGEDDIAGPPAGWQTRLTVLTYLDRAGEAAVAAADLVITQRLGAPEAAHAGQALRLPPPQAEALGTLEPEMLALCGGGTSRHVRLCQTTVEHELLGAPQR